MSQSCALVIGHKKTSPGAKNKNKNVTEFDFNEDLAMRIEKKVKDTVIRKIYPRASVKITNEINALGPGFVVGLHCNVNNNKTSGTEVLYYQRSTKGKQIAKILLDYLVDFLRLPNRGIQPKTVLDREGSLLRSTEAPFVIAKPFFIDNDADLTKALEQIEGLANAYAKAIDKITQMKAISNNK
jgi:N-acetylmuramoyl-L-alanine amidase